MKTLYFDCYCGASGDMILGAFIDAGVSFEHVRDQLATLPVEGYHLHSEKIDKHGTAATQFKVHVDGIDEEHHHDPADGHSHGHAHSHEHTHDHEHAPEHSHEHSQGHAQPHRHLRHIVEMIEASQLSDTVKQRSIATFKRIAVCEAEVHGTTPEKIHFHEVGAVDSIVDIVGAHVALEVINPDRILSSPLHVGSGTVKCAHGIMPVPAPATALLLKGIPSYGGEVKGELVTPTGAAIIAEWAESFGPMPHMVLETVGVGSGTKDLPDRPNTLRIMIGETTDTAQSLETIAVIEANIDDMNPELLPALLEDLLAIGARDAFITPIVMKKGRPGHLVTVLADEDKIEAASQVLFQSSSTLGVRIRREERICLDREWRTATTPWGDVKIKIGKMNEEIVNQAPEYEDCLRIARAANIPVIRVYESALAAAVKGEMHDG